MQLGDKIAYDFDKLDLGFLGSEEVTPSQIENMKRALGDTLTHLDLIRLLSDRDTWCHVDSYFRPVSEREASIRMSRGGREYCCVPAPIGDTAVLGLNRVRALAVLGAMMAFLEESLRSMGVNATLEARTDLNRFHTMAAMEPDGHVWLFFDVGEIYPHYRNDTELMHKLVEPVSDLTFSCTVMSLFHLARHGIQMNLFRRRDIGPDYEGMRRRFQAGREDPAYYSASYPENLMCLEAELCAAVSGLDFFTSFFPHGEPKVQVLSYLNYKCMWYNTENLLFPVQGGYLPDTDYAVAGLAQKMFKTKAWYESEPDHDRVLRQEDQKACGWDVPGGKARSDT